MNLHFIKARPSFVQHERCCVMAAAEKIGILNGQTDYLQDVANLFKPRTIVSLWLFSFVYYKLRC